VGPNQVGSQEQGFTLIELLVVMIILAILTAIAVPSYLSFRDRANNSAAGANVRAIVPSIESYLADNGTYTGMTITGLQASYDQAIRTTAYSLSGLSGTSYCISSTVNGKTYRKVGPAGAIAAGAVC
jgi:type IV pilus assembly protein PilA